MSTGKCMLSPSRMNAGKTQPGDWVYSALQSERKQLLHFNFSTSLFESFLQGFSFVFRNAFFHRLRSTVNQFFRFFQAKTGQIFHNLHHLQLTSAGALQDYVERSLFFSGRGITTSSSATSYNYRSSSSRLDTVLILQDLCEFVNFLNRQVYQLLSKCFQICHFIIR